MKKSASVILIFLLVMCTFFAGTNYAYAQTDSSGGSSSGGGSIGGQYAGVGCIWNTSTDPNRPYTYMFDLVRRKKSGQNDYTRIASAVVGAHAKGNVEFESRNNVKRITASGSVSKVKNIQGLAGLAQYLNSHDDVSSIGTSLTQNQVWEMLVDFGVAAYDRRNEQYYVKEKYESQFQIEQSSKLKDSYGYRILIQEFHTYKDSCVPSGSEVYLLRKESSRARSYTNNGLGKKKELKLSQSGALGISKYTGGSPWSDSGALADKMNGDGYNVIWMIMDAVLTKYRCYYNETAGGNRCDIESTPSSNKNWDRNSSRFKVKKEGTVYCNDLNQPNSKWKTHKLETVCPTITYDCTDKNQSGGLLNYGKCNIREYYQPLNGQRKFTGPIFASGGENIACNALDNKTSKKGKESFTVSRKSMPLEIACPFKPRYNYDVDAVCKDCKNDSKSYNTNGSFQVQDTTNWTAILHSLKRTDRDSSSTALKQYYKVPNKNVLCREEFNVVFPDYHSASKVFAEPGRYFTVNEKGSYYVNGAYNFQPIKVTRTRQCISTTYNNEAVAREELKQYAKQKPITRANMGQVNLNYKEDKYGPNSGRRIELKSEYIASDRFTVTDPERLPFETKYISSAYGDEYVKAGNYVISTMKAEAYFSLPGDKIKKIDIFRYIATVNTIVNGKKYEAGESVYNDILIDSAASKQFDDIGGPNLPISVNNKKGATVQLNYQLPGDSKLASIIRSGNANNLEPHPTEFSDYEEYARNSRYDISKTACYKMYSDPATVRSCALNRNNNYSSINNCLKHFGNYNGNDWLYSCEIKTNECTEANHTAKGQDWNPTTGECCPVGTKYNKISNTCERGCYEIAASENNERRFMCWTDNTKTSLKICDEKEYAKVCELKCVVKDGHYYGQNGEDLGTGSKAEEEYKKVCPEKGKCTLHCEAGYCCPDTTMECPTWDDEKQEWSCPVKGGDKIIYRTIDLTYPFPSPQGGIVGRKTGSNWCSVVWKTDGTGYKTVCDNNNGSGTSLVNPVVYREIKNNRKTETEDVYSKTPMYSFTLEPGKIKEIRKYNKRHGYNEDDSLYYKKVATGDGGYKGLFFSKFIRGAKYVTINKGTCLKSSSTNEFLRVDKNGRILCAEGGSNE